MGSCCSKSVDAPEAEETEFQLRKTADGRRLESAASLKSSEELRTSSGNMSGGISGILPRSDDDKHASIASKTQKPKSKDFKEKKKSALAAGNEDDMIAEDIQRIDTFTPRRNESLSDQTRKILADNDDDSRLRLDIRDKATKTEEAVELSARLKRYENEPKLAPNVLPKWEGPEWIAPPDIKQEDTVQKPKAYAIGDLSRGDHVLRERNVFDIADFSTYIPGTGPIFNGPTPEMLKSSAKEAGLNLSKIGMLAMLAMTYVPNVVFSGKLSPDASTASHIRRLLAFASTILIVYVLLSLKIQIERMFWRASLVQSQIATAIICAICFTWQVTVIYSIDWLSNNRGVFSFLFAFIGGWLVVRKHETRLQSRAEIDAVLSAFLEIEKNAARMTELMGLPAVRTNDMQYMNAAPVWARYRPDELVPWLNNLLTTVWPFYNKAVSGMLREILDPLMEATRPSMLKRLTFKELDFGENPFVFRNFTYVGTKAEGMATSIDVDFAWAGKSNIVLAAKTHIGADINIAVKDLEIYTKLRITLNPLVPLPSPLGGLTVSMTERPIVEFHCELPSGLDVLYNVVDKWLEEFVADLLGDMFIQPERLVIPLSFNFDPITMPDGEIKPFKWYDTHMLQLRNTGVLKATVVRAENIPRTDLLSKTDPYVKMFVKKHGLQVQTTTMMNNEDPIWNETFYIPVDDVDLRTLKVSVLDYDSDPLSYETRLAMTEVRIDTIKDATEDGAEKELWLDFPEQVAGNVKKPPMRLLLNTQFIQFGSVAAKELFAGLGLLTVHVIRGINLQVMDSNGLSDPYVKVKLPVESMSSSSALMDKETRKSARKKNKDGKDFIVYTSKIHYKNLNPEFNARFEFSPASEQSKVIIELFDVDSTFPIGTKSNFMGNLEVPIATILEHGGSMEARFKVGNAKSGELDIAFNWQSYS